jgi:hypothetical protein
VAAARCCCPRCSHAGSEQFGYDWGPVSCQQCKRLRATAQQCVAGRGKGLGEARNRTQAQIDSATQVHFQQRKEEQLMGVRTAVVNRCGRYGKVRAHYQVTSVLTGCGRASAKLGIRCQAYS